MGDIEKTTGYAVIFDGKINVRTISDTRRAAIVNWLVVHGGCPILANTTDDEIEQLWANHRGGAVVSMVTISRSPVNVR